MASTLALVLAVVTDAMVMQHYVLCTDRNNPVRWHVFLYDWSDSRSVDVVYFPWTRQSALGTGTVLVLLVCPESLFILIVGFGLFLSVNSPLV